MHPVLAIPVGHVDITRGTLHCPGRKIERLARRALLSRSADRLQQCSIAVEDAYGSVFALDAVEVIEPAIESVPVAVMLATFERFPEMYVLP